MNSKSGQVLIESVLFFFIIAMLFFGAVELGNAYLMSNQLSKAAREAARYASVMPDLEASRGNFSWLGVQYRMARSLEEMNIDPGGVNWSITWEDQAGVPQGGGSNDDARNSGFAERGDIIKVRITAPLNLLSGVRLDFLQNLTVRGEAVAEKVV